MESYPRVFDPVYRGLVRAGESTGRLAEVLAMVYLGGLNAVAGSIVGAVGFVMLSEALRPLEILKWIMIPVLLILLMIFRPTGLIAFREFEPEKFLRPKVEFGKQTGARHE